MSVIYNRNRIADDSWEELSKASKYIGKYVRVGKIIYRKSKLNEGNKLNLKT